MGIDRSVAKGCYRAVSEQFDATGRFYFEMWIRTPGSGKTWCDMAIHLIDPDPHVATNLLVGIEVKDWADPVPPSVIKKEFEGYRHQFDYFFFAANEYAPSVEDLELEHLGRIDMRDGFEIVENPRAQPTFSWNRRKFIARLGHNWKANYERLREQYGSIMDIGDAGGPEEPVDPEQRTLSSLGGGAP